MVLFGCGFITALVLAVILFALSRRCYLKNTSIEGDVHQKQIEELSKLTGGLAHEIKNPLSTIKVNLKLISENIEPSDAESIRLLRKIQILQKETDRLTQILDNFLRYIGRAELQLEAVDINSLVEEMADFYDAQARSNNITMRVGLNREPLVCNIDEDMIKQVLLNLFINAQQAITEQGEIIVKTACQGSNAVITISDTGKGIDAEKLEKIFDAYYSSRPGGSGLGLPTAKKIINAHNGYISVDSHPGKGTSFSISLPLTKV
ncbi:MAG: hypothetical protein JW912_06410 [Sedimentisphaerales bacterium]|nr:hypothetical protein [Sedimentisphaerales bacterium]